MPRPLKRSSNQRSLFIYVLIISIIFTIFINVVFSWYYSRATDSKIYFISDDIIIAKQILNDKTLDLTEEELFAGSTAERTVRLQNNSENPNFFIRLKLEARIDGFSTDYITLGIDEQAQDVWFAENISHPEWYYFYTDFNTYEQLNNSDRINIPLLFNISENASEDRLERKITLILHIELLQTQSDNSHWENPPINWPYEHEQESEV